MTPVPLPAHPTGNFHTKRAPMTFTEQERDGFEWDDEGAHREATP